MDLESIPFVGPLLSAGADDSVFDALLLLGPIVIVAVTILGRTPTSILLALAYTGGFLGYTASKGLRETAEDNT
jgi:hypothetical protein